MVSITRNKRRLWLLGLFSLALVGFTLGALADYQVRWSSINAGGHTSVSGKYVVLSSIGQAAVRALSGQRLRLQTGFWAYLGAAEADHFIFLPMVVR